MAGRIPQHFIDDLLARVDIVDVVNERVTLKKSGSNWSACCPFHNEKTPSFTVSQSKQFYHCFGCSANGSAIGFLMEYEGMHFVDAIEILADSVGMDVPRDEQAAQHRDDSKPLYALMDEVSRFYQTRLKESPEAIDYLKGRGLTGETVKRFGIGYVPDGWDALQKQFPDSEAALVKTGMLIQGDAGKRPYQRFRNRIMFPIRDRRGRVIGFGGRVMGNDEPKYLNSPETPLFHKGSELYGLHEARKSAQDSAQIIVVEGYMDVVALAHHGVNNAVATLGTAANQQHSDMLFRIVPNIVFCFDGDRAGRAAAWRALVATLPVLQDGKDAHFLFLPDGEDPDSIVRNEGAAGFHDRLTTRIPIIDYLYEHLSEDVDVRSVGGKATLAEKARPLLATIPKGVYKQLAVRRLESLIGLSLGSARMGQVANTGAGASRYSGAHAATRRTGQPTIVSTIASLIIQYPKVVVANPEETFDVLEDLPQHEADILQRLIGYCDKEPDISTARLLERFRDHKHHAYLQALATRSHSPTASELDLETAVEEFTHYLGLLRKKAGQSSVEKVDIHQRTGLLGLRKR